MPQFEEKYIVTGSFCINFDISLVRCILFNESIL